MAGPAVEVVDLVKRYDGREEVLDGVTFSIDSGEFVTLYGKSGCGKTTLLNIIGGLDRPTAGTVKIEGHDIVGLSEDELAKMRLDKIGFVFQDYNLLDDLTVRENIELPLKFSGKKVARGVDDLVREFGIERVAKEKPNRISGGEAQRVAVARAMMNEPKIILADEPTGNLDEDNTANVMEVFQMIGRDFGTTVVLATHDQELARFATTRLFLDSGKVSRATD